MCVFGENNNFAEERPCNAAVVNPKPDKVMSAGEAECLGLRVGGEARRRRDLIWTPRKSPQGYYFPLLVYYNQHFISADYEELLTITGRASPGPPPPPARAVWPCHTLHDKCVLFFRHRRDEEAPPRRRRRRRRWRIPPSRRTRTRPRTHMRNCPAAALIFTTDTTYICCIIFIVYRVARKEFTFSSLSLSLSLNIYI